MSSESDQNAFEASIHQQDRVNLFEAKKWATVTDTGSSNGKFNGQLQFNLETLSAQGRFSDLSNSYVTIPIRLRIKNNTANAPSPAMTVNTATIQSGFHNFVDSIQVTINNSTLQSSQIFTNINTTFKVLSEWSQDELHKWGPSLGLAVDDIIGADNAMGATDSVDNLPVPTANIGFRIDNDKNPGVKERLTLLNNNVANAALGRIILGANQPVVGKSTVQVGTSAVINENVFVMYALATVKLSMLADCIKQFPMCQNIKGFIYINYNSTKSTLVSGTATSTVATYGRCCPGVLTMAYTALPTNAVEFECDVSGEALTTGLTTAQPISTNATLYCPQYSPTPEITRSLSMRKTLRYDDVFVTQFAVKAGTSINQTITPGISNAKKLILYPYFTSGSTFLANPLLSPFSGEPNTTSPLAVLSQLQVMLGNVPAFNQPQNYDFNQFLQEMGDVADKSLLSLRMWNQLYRYYCVNLQRRLNSEDGSSKSIQVSLYNPTVCDMNIIAFVHFEREITVDTVSGQITQGM